MINRQNGMSMIAILYLLGTFCFFLLIGLRLFPLYNEKLYISRSMDSVATRKDITKLPTKQVVKHFLRTAQVSGSQRLNSNNAKDYIKVLRQKGKDKPRLLKVSFEMRNKFIADVEFVMKFDRTVELSGRVP